MSQTKMKFAAKKEAITDKDIENIIASFDRGIFRSLSYLTIIFGSITDEQAAELAPHLSTARLQRLKLSFKEISGTSTTLILQQIAKNANLSVANITLDDREYTKKDLVQFTQTHAMPTAAAPALSSLVSSQDTGAASEIPVLISRFNQLLADVQKDFSDVKATVTGAIEGLNTVVSDVGNDALNAFNHAKAMMTSCLPTRNYLEGDKQELDPHAANAAKTKLKTA